MAGSQFVYVTFIRTTPQRLWDALTNTTAPMDYWFGCRQECDWKAGSPWTLYMSDGRIADAGKILEVEPAKRAVIEWRNEFKPEYKAEGPARCTYELEQMGDVVKLTIVHTHPRENAKFIEAVSGGWPKILSNLKSLLEGGAIIIKPAA